MNIFLNPQSVSITSHAIHSDHAYIESMAYTLANCSTTNNSNYWLLYNVPIPCICSTRRWPYMIGLVCVSPAID